MPTPATHLLPPLGNLDQLLNVLTIYPLLTGVISYLTLPELLNLLLTCKDVYRVLRPSAGSLLNLRGRSIQSGAGTCENCTQDVQVCCKCGEIVHVRSPSHPIPSHPIPSHPAPHIPPKLPRAVDKKLMRESDGGGRRTSGYGK